MCMEVFPYFLPLPLLQHKTKIISRIKKTSRNRINKTGIYRYYFYSHCFLRRDWQCICSTSPVIMFPVLFVCISGKRFLYLHPDKGAALAVLAQGIYVSGCSVARYRASMGCWRSWVRIPPSRQCLNRNKLNNEFIAIFCL